MFINIYMDTDKKKKKNQKSIHENTLKSLKQDVTLVFSVAAAFPATLHSLTRLMWQLGLDPTEKVFNQRRVKGPKHAGQSVPF